MEKPSLCQTLFGNRKFLGQNQLVTDLTFGEKKGNSFKLKLPSFDILQNTFFSGN